MSPKFDINSERAQRGLKFQERIHHSIKTKHKKTKTTRNWLLDIDPCLSEIQLNVLERTWGDLVILDNKTGNAVAFVECVSLKDECSIFPESKVIKYNGENKYYAFTWKGGPIKFIHSRTWNAYARKLKTKKIGKRAYREFTRKNIKSIRKSCCTSADKFLSLIEIKK
jgi:hypothetical protein